MKKIKYLFLSLLILVSCSKKSDEPVILHNVNFGFSISSQPGRIASAEPDHLIVSIEDDTGSPFLTEHVISLTPFGNSFISTPVELSEGNYFLTAFMVVDASGSVIYATPLEGSEKAYLVSDPLPLEFNVSGDELNTVDPEVLPISGTDNPAEFGYLSFGFNVVSTFSLNLSAIDDNSGSFIAADIMVVGYNSGDQAMLETVVSTNESDLVVFELLPNLEYYQFVLNHPDYYPIDYIIETEDLESIEDFPFILSSPQTTARIEVGQIFIDWVDNPQKIHIYTPYDGCEKDLRIDYGGHTVFSHIISLDATNISGTFYENVEYVDQLYPEIGFGSHQIGSPGVAEDICESYSDENELRLDKWLVVTYGQHDLYFTSIWDNATGQWIQTTQYITDRYNDDALVFSEEYNLNQ